MKNPFEKKPPVLTDDQLIRNEWEQSRSPKVTGEMTGDSGILQLEFNMVDSEGPVDNLKDVENRTFERANHFGRAKVVLAVELDKIIYDEICRKTGRQGAKVEFKEIILSALRNRKSVLIERISGEPFVYVEDQEYYDLQEQVNSADPKSMWAFAFDNSVADMINPGNLKMIYSHL